MLSQTEEIIGKIWAELLYLEKIDFQDNFFEMGGDSMMMLTMLFRVGQVFDVDVRPAVLMNAPTLGEFCKAIDDKQSETDDETGEIVFGSRKDHLPVSFIQEQIIGAELAGLYNPDETRSHCLDLCYRIEGRISVPALDMALREVVRRHEILRTSYSVEDGTIFQNVNDVPQSILQVEDLRHLTHGDRERETKRILKRVAAASFSFFQDKLMMSATLIVGKPEHTLAIVVNHIAIDGLSMEILKTELFLLYRTYSHFALSPLDEPPIQYADFAGWEREYFSGGRLENKLAYWRGLSGKPLNTTLPVDHTPTAISYAGDIVSITIPLELVTDLQRLAQKCKVTLFTVLFAAYISLIHVFSGYRYNFFCMPVANRTRKETQSLIGCFMNFQFVYIDLSGNPTLLEIVERLNRTLQDVYDNYVPFHFITQQIPPQGPVVDFQLRASPYEYSSVYPLELSLSPFRLQSREFALFPIDVRLLNSSENIIGHFKYQTAVYDRETIMGLVNDYAALLTRAVREPDIRLTDMDIKPHGISRN